MIIIKGDLMAFRIHIDSCCDLDPSPAPMINMHILLGEEDITDQVNAMQDNYHTYYDNMRNGTHYTTSQPTPEEFIRQWTPTLEEGLDILYLGFSSVLSGTVQSAYIAREELLKRFPERKIIVVDTLCASAGQGLLIEYVIEKQNSGASLEETAEYAESIKNNINHIFTVSDLKYLRRSGRLTATAAAFGTILDIKPILKTDSEGRLVPLTKCKGIKRAISVIAETPVKRHAKDPQHMILCHADDMDLCMRVYNAVMERIPDAKIRIANIGPVIGSHSGPGTIALFFLGDHKDLKD